jgi:hypothetical protein
VTDLFFEPGERIILFATAWRRRHIAIPDEAAGGHIAEPMNPAPRVTRIFIPQIPCRTK